jgi:putative flavoprotein involved in K+ transport
MGQHVLTRRNPIGRKVLPKLMQGGTPVVRIKPKDLVEAGVEQVPRVAGVRDGLPVLEDERVLNVSNIIWCTGFRTSFSWIDLPVFAPDGTPLHERGVVDAAPGLYFVGLAFQFAATSDTVTGVGRDVAFVARHLRRHPVASTAGGSLVGANAGDGDDGQPRTGT